MAFSRAYACVREKLRFQPHPFVIPGKPRSGADPKSIGGLRRSTMDSGSPLRSARNDGGEGEAYPRNSEIASTKVSPYCASLRSPTPSIIRISSKPSGRSRAMAIRVRSVKMI